MEPWHWWVIAALVLLIFEIFFSDFLLAMLGVAALGAAIVAAFGLAFPWQLGAFIAGALVALILLRPFLKKLLYRGSGDARTNHDALHGVAGTVLEPVGDETAPGRVKVGAEEWRAISAASIPLPAGTAIEVVSIDSATLLVRRREASQPSPET